MVLWYKVGEEGCKVNYPENCSGTISKNLKTKQKGLVTCCLNFNRSVMKYPEKPKYLEQKVVPIYLPLNFFYHAPE